MPFGVCGDLFVKFDGRLWEAASSIMQFDKLASLDQTRPMGLAAQPRILNAFYQAFMPVIDGRDVLDVWDVEQENAF